MPWEARNTWFWILALYFNGIWLLFGTMATSGAYIFVFLLKRNPISCFPLQDQGLSFHILNNFSPWFGNESFVHKKEMLIDRCTVSVISYCSKQFLAFVLYLTLELLFGEKKIAIEVNTDILTNLL